MENCKSKEELVCGEIFIMKIVYVIYGLRRQLTSGLARGWGDNTLLGENLRVTVLQRSHCCADEEVMCSPSPRSS